MTHQPPNRIEELDLEPLPDGDLPIAPRALQHRFEHNGLVWLDFVSPRHEQIAYLRQHYHFHPLNLEDVTSRLQRPKIDDSENPQYLFLVLHLPVFNEITRLSTVSEVDIFAGPNYVITLHEGRLKPLKLLAQRAGDERARQELMSRGSGYLLYRIIEELSDATFPMLYRLDQKLDVVEENIFVGDPRRMVEDLSYLRRDIISLRRIIKPNIPVLSSLSVRERPFLRLDEDVYFGDLVDAFSRLWDMLEEQKEIIEGLDATLFSWISNRINNEMKTFTLISVIFLPMTLIASILGMNVIIPFQDQPFSLVISIIVMLIVGGLMFAYFRRKGWV